MKTLTIFLVAFGFATASFAQSSAYTKRIDSVSVLVEKFFNARSPEKIYTLLSKDVQNKIPAKTWKTIFEENFFPYGKIVSRRNVKFEMGVTTYQLTFDSKSVLLMTVKIDSQNKLTDINFNPPSKK